MLSSLNDYMYGMLAVRWDIKSRPRGVDGQTARKLGLRLGAPVVLSIIFLKVISLTPERYYSTAVAFPNYVSPFGSH